MPADWEGLEWLARLLLELAQERSLDGVLRKAIDAAAAVPGVKQVQNAIAVKPAS